MADGSFQRQNFRGPPPQGGMNMMPGMQQMGMRQFGMAPPQQQQQQQRMMYPGQQQMMPQQQMMMQRGMQPMAGGMRPQGQMMQSPVSMGMQPQMHSMPNQMGPGVHPQQQQRMQQPGFQGQQMQARPGNFQRPGGFGPNPQQQFRAPPPYTPQMAQTFTMRMQGQKQPTTSKPSQQPAKTMEQDLKHRNFQSTQRRLMELGRLGPKKVDADSMIEAIMGKKEAEKPKQPQIQPEKTSDPDDSFGDFIHGPATETNENNMDQETGEVAIENQDDRSAESDKQPQEEKKDIMSMMLECSDLTKQTKAKTFHKPTVKEIHVKNLRSASFQQSQKAAKWQNATDALSDLFTIEVKQPEPPPAPENIPDQANQQQVQPGQYPVQPGQQPGQVLLDASGQPVYPQGQVTSASGQPVYAQGQVPTSSGQPVYPQGQQVPTSMAGQAQLAGPGVPPGPGMPPQSTAGYGTPPYSTAGNVPQSAAGPTQVPGGPGVPPHSAASPGLPTAPGGPGVPPPNNQTQPMQLPPHIHPMFFNTAVIPELYFHVLEATIQNGVIDTTLVYGLLLRSQLPKELLGHIWSLANKFMPGQLIKEELFVILAMIAMAQQKKDISTLDILKECQQPPVPNLGQNTQSQPQQNQAAVPGQPLVNQNQPADDQDEFADFHQAPPPTSNSFGDFVSSPAHLKPSGDQSSGANSMFPASAAKSKEEDNDFEEFKSAEPIAPPKLKGKPFGQFLKHDHHNIKVHGQKQDLHFDFDPCKQGSESSSLSSYKLDSMSHGSDSSKTSTSFNDEFDDFRSAESSENSSFGSYGGYQQSNTSNSTVKEQEIIGPEDKFGALKVVKTDINEPKHGKFSMFRTEDIGSDGKPINIKEAIVFKDLGKDGKNVEAADAALTTGQQSGKTDGWANFENAFTSKTDKALSGGIGALDMTGKTVDSFGNFTQAPPTAQGSDTDKYGAFKDLGASQNAPLGLFSSSQTEENKDNAASKVLDDGDDDNFGDFSSFSSAPSSLPPTLPTSGTTTSEFNVIKPKPIKPTKNIFLPQPKTVGFSELSYGAMPDEPPDWDAGDDHDDDDDEDFAEFTGVSTLHSQDWISDADNVPGKSRFQPPHFKPRTLDTTHRIDITGDADVHSPPSLTSPVSDTKQDDLAKSQSLTSLDSLSSNKVQFKEDTQSVGSFDLGGTIRMKELKDPAAVGADTHSISSAGSLDSGEKKYNPDQQSVRSLEFKQGSEVEVNGDGFGEFSSSMSNNKSGNDGESQPWPSMNNGIDASTWTQAPRDASELLTDGSAVLGDRYSSATHEIQDIEKHAYEWERCLESCLEMINNANNVFNSISRSVCNEVIKSEQGAEYVASVIEIYRVVCRITLSIKVAAVTNSKLLKLLKDIDLSWNNLTAFISTNSTMPDSSSFDYRKCVLKSDEDKSQQKACGICLLNVDGQSKSLNKEEVPKFTYGGRQYHATCANYWVNCVDPMLPSLRLPELL